MALHMNGVTSRHTLVNPDEKPVVKPTYESVLKFNPNHGPDGKFTSGGGGRRGGTAGAPTEDALGNPLRPKGGGPHINPYDQGKDQQPGEWVRALGRNASQGIPAERLNWPHNKKIVNAGVRRAANAMAKGITSHSKALAMADEADFENYHEVGSIFRARAKALRSF